MRVYVDLVLFLNIAMDFLLLLSVSVILKRNVKFYRIILGSLVGGCSILLLFVSLNNFSLFLFKMIISVLMVLVTFSYKDIKYFWNNLLYLYLSSIILGGGIYLLDIQLNYENQGLMFVSSGFGLNLVVLVVLSPFILYSYIKSMKKIKNNYSNFYKVDVYYKDEIYKFEAFLDTGNRLYDPYHKRPISIIYTDKIKLAYEQAVIVPYHTANGNSLLKCFVAERIVIDKKFEVTDVLIGLSEEKFHIEGVNMLLHNDLIGGIK